MRAKHIVGILVLGTGLQTAWGAGIVNNFNNGGGDGNWNTAANWNPAGLPGSGTAPNSTSGDQARIAAYTVALNNTEPTAGQVYLAIGGAGTLNVSTGANLTLGDGFFDGWDHVGTYNQTGGAIMVNGANSFEVSRGAGTAGSSFSQTGGSLIIGGGGSFDVGYGAAATAAVDGGSLTGSSTVEVGFGGNSTLAIKSGTVSTGNFQVGQSGGSNTGALTLGGGSSPANVSWGGFMDVRGGTGSLSVVGSGSSLMGTRSSGDGLLIGANDSVNFTFDSAGISPINLTTSTLNLSTTNTTLNLDGSGVTGPGVYTLLDYAADDGGNTFSNVDYTGFSAGDTESVQYNPGSITLTVAAPEPGSFALIGLAGLGLLARRRRVHA